MCPGLPIFGPIAKAVFRRLIMLPSKSVPELYYWTGSAEAAPGPRGTIAPAGTFDLKFLELN